MSAVFLLPALFLGTLSHAQEDPRWEFESIPQDIELEDSVELWNGAEFDTGWVPSGSPLAVRFQIQSTGGADVEMEGQGFMGWPDGLTMAIDPIPNSGEILVDAALEAVTSIKFDIDIYSWESEIDRRGIDVEGEAEFTPFLLSGDVPDVVDVIFEGDTNELLEWSFTVFTGVDAQITVDLGPEAITSFQGSNWYVDGERLDSAGQEAWVEPLGEAYQDVQVEFVGSWQSSLDLVLNPVFSVCVDIIGCYDLVDTDIPIPLASDDFDQFFPSEVVAFPLPVMGDLPPRHDFGTIEVGQTATLELPIENIGALDLEGLAYTTGSTTFSVYPEYFQAGPAATDGIVLSFTPTEEGDFEGRIVLESNDPLEPAIEIPLLASAKLPVGDDSGTDGGSDGLANAGGGGSASPQVIKTVEGGCSCSNTGESGREAPMGLAVVLLGGLALLRRRSDGRG